MIRHPYTSLLAIFVGWTSLLLLIALVNPGLGYDTSTELLLHGQVSTAFLDRILRKLTRWDAVYFARIAERGYELEQEWAFGWGWTSVLGWLARCIPITKSNLQDAIVHGIVVANVSHLLSVLVLYQLALALPLGPNDRRPISAFVAAVLHTISPAGIFLVAPFTESLFSLLNIGGQLFYVYSHATHGRHHGIIQDLYLILAGTCFGLASTVRGNGLFSGIILFFDAVLWFGIQVEARTGFRVLNVGILPRALQTEVKSFKSRRLPATIVAGLLAGVGFATPQYIAYQDYCSMKAATRRPWCGRFPPSIFTFVQSHYWNNGFLRYWTVSNIPLFLLAAPVLYTLFRTSWLSLIGRSYSPTTTRGKEHIDQDDLRREALLLRLALPQLALAAASLTTFHAQIVTRLSSGYPVWYMILATEILDRKRGAKWMTRWFVMYALIQAVLFTAFLPPA